jgi:hypothetical protein
MWKTNKLDDNIKMNIKVAEWKESGVAPRTHACSLYVSCLGGSVCPDCSHLYSSWAPR